MKDQSLQDTYTLNVYFDDEIGIFFYDGIPLVTKVHSQSRMILGTDGYRSEVHRKLINTICNKVIVDDDWKVEGKDFQDGMDLPLS